MCVSYERNYIVLWTLMKLEKEFSKYLSVFLVSLTTPNATFFLLISNSDKISTKHYIIMTFPLERYPEK